MYNWIDMGNIMLSEESQRRGTGTELMHSSAGYLKKQTNHHHQNQSMRINTQRQQKG